MSPVLPPSPQPISAYFTITHLLLGDKASLPGGDLLLPPAMLRILPEITEKIEREASEPVISECNSRALIEGHPAPLFRVISFHICIVLHQGYKR